MFLIVLILVKFSAISFTITSINTIITNYQLRVFIMEDFDVQSIDIHAEVFDKDFDEVGFDPIEEDDSDEECAQIFGY